MKRIVATACLFVLIVGCKQEKPAPPPKQTLQGISYPPPGKAHPLHKFVELAGFRLVEMKPGRLRLKFLAVNHSMADIGDLEMHVTLKTAVAKPGDPDIADFKAKVQGLGPEEYRDVTVEIPTKLKTYEVPDWQFVRAQFEITSPAP